MITPKWSALSAQTLVSLSALIAFTILGLRGVIDGAAVVAAISAILAANVGGAVAVQKMDNDNGSSSDSGKPKDN